MPWLEARFSRKLTFAFALVTALAVISSGLFLYLSFRANLFHQLARSLTTEAAAIAIQTDPADFSSRNTGQLQDLAKRLGNASGSRVTFIARDGRVLGDSAETLDSLSLVENHSMRPEVLDAIKSGQGVAQRLSDTIGRNFIYAAVPIKNGTEAAGVVRTAMPLDEFSRQLEIIALQTFWIAIVVLFLAMAVALRLARSFSRPVEEMSEAGRRIASGSFHVRLRDLSMDEHGRLGRVLNQLAERVQSQVEELWADREQLRAVLSSLREGVAAVDSQGRVVTVNQALCTLFNIDSALAPGRAFIEVLRQSSLDQLVQTVLQGAAEQLMEVHTFSPDERIFEAHVVPLQKNNQRVGALLVLHDITRLRRLEQIRRDFVANVSHELRTPLAAIKGFSETLRTGGIEDKNNRLDFVTGIERHADRMSELVNDLLDLAAIESGQRPPVFEPVVVAEIVSDVLTDLAPQAKRNKISIRAHVSDGLPKVRADRGQIRQVLVNLIDNAIKFSPEKTEVTVSAQAPQGATRVNVVISDQGRGIPSQDLPRIFERFYRVDKARSREMGGTGLGLSIVKHLLEIHGGTISVESSVGKGTTFNVSLPVYTGPLS